MTSSTHSRTKFPSSSEPWRVECSNIRAVFTTAYKSRLRELIAERFKVTTEPEIPSDCLPARARQLRLKKNRELFYLVYHAVGETSLRPLTFNAHYGLFRVLLTMFGLLALASLAGVVWAVCCRPVRGLAFGLWAAVFLAATVIAYFRCKKRAEDFALSVYDQFMAAAIASWLVS